jgi:hypothetical protein
MSSFYTPFKQKTRMSEGHFHKYPNVEGQIRKLERWQGHF